MNFKNISPNEFRNFVRKGNDVTTDGVCPGYAHANLIIVPKEYAYDLLIFCLRNNFLKSILEIAEAGNPYTAYVANKADIRKDLPKYKIFKCGKIFKETNDISSYWSHNFVSFFIKCTKSFEWLLRAYNIEWIKHGLFIADIPCNPAGPFYGNLVVTLREFYRSEDAIKAINLTSRNKIMQGTPYHMGPPSIIGIKEDLICKGIKNTNQESILHNTMISWDSGATIKKVVEESKLPIVITNGNARMFVTDLLIESISDF